MEVISTNPLGSDLDKNGSSFVLNDVNSTIHDEDSEEDEGPSEEEMLELAEQIKREEEEDRRKLPQTASATGSTVLTDELEVSKFDTGRRTRGQVSSRVENSSALAEKSTANEVSPLHNTGKAMDALELGDNSVNTSSTASALTPIPVPHRG